jgi:hypothetical protein
MLGLISAVLLFGPRNASSQNIHEVRLAPPTAQLAEELFGLSTGRELADGRFLIGEGSHTSRRLLVVDFQRGTMQQLGRRGQGPGEYRLVSRLFPLANDSTLFVADDMRWLVLSGSRIVRTISGPDAAMMSARIVHGADSMGNLLSSERGTPSPDSSGHTLVARANGKTTFVARLRSSTETGYPPRSTPRGRGGLDYFNGPWNGYELAHLFPDGWLAVARVQPYRVDWRAPNGKWIFGKPIPSPVVRVTEKEKVAYVQRAAARSGNAPQAPSVHSTWPKEIPPFLPGSLIAGSDGRLLILRTPTADRPDVRYDIVDRQGRVEQQLLLGQNQRIFAFGKKSVYVVVTDDDGLQRIQRHPWPTR